MNEDVFEALCASTWNEREGGVRGWYTADDSEKSAWYADVQLIITALGLNGVRL